MFGVRAFFNAKFQMGQDDDYRTINNMFLFHYQTVWNYVSIEGFQRGSNLQNEVERLNVLSITSQCRGGVKSKMILDANPTDS